MVHLLKLASSNFSSFLWAGQIQGWPKSVCAEMGKPYCLEFHWGALFTFERHASVHPGVVVAWVCETLESHEGRWSVVCLLRRVCPGTTRVLSYWVGYASLGPQRWNSTWRWRLFCNSQFFLWVNAKQSDFKVHQMINLPRDRHTVAQSCLWLYAGFWEGQEKSSNVKCNCFRISVSVSTYEI